MKNIYKRNRFILCLLALGALLFSSCGTPQNVVYMSNLDSVKYTQIQRAQFKQPLIQTDDILNITIQTQDITETSALNQTSLSPGGAQAAPVAAGAGGAATAAISGFLVNQNGNVEIPILGVVKVAGLTTDEARELVKSKASKFYKDPTVQVRFSNYKITMLGEVNKPSTYTMPNEKVTIFDAISLAGDLTIYGKRNNIMLMRDNGDKKDIVRLDLNSSTILSSPYYYLQQNDVIYVEPSKAKAAANNAPRIQLISIALATATLLVALLTRL